VRGSRSCTAGWRGHDSAIVSVDCTFFASGRRLEFHVVKVESIDAEGLSILIEAAWERLHLRTDFVHGDGVRLDRCQVEQLAAVLDNCRGLVELGIN
jgi:hypothetical protein